MTCESVSRDMEALARRAVACRHWRWMPGMLYRVTRAEPLEQIVGRVPDLFERCSARVPAGALPDLTDPATLGCLLSLVREEWNEATTQIDYGEWWVAAWDRTQIGVGATEVEALVSALENEP